jgi:hypothetical protein
MDMSCSDWRYHCLTSESSIFYDNLMESSSNISFLIKECHEWMIDYTHLIPSNTHPKLTLPYLTLTPR